MSHVGMITLVIFQCNAWMLLRSSPADSGISWEQASVHIAKLFGLLVASYNNALDTPATAMWKYTLATIHKLWFVLLI